MKKTKIIFLVAVLVFGVLGSFNLVEAGCCVNTIMATCSDADANTDCPLIGLELTDYNSGSCSNINICPQYRPNAVGCCMENGSCYEPVNNKCSVGTLNSGKTCEEFIAAGTCVSGKITITPGKTDPNAPIEFANPIKIKTVSELLDSILNNLMGIIVIIAVIFIIIGGIMYMSSAGNEKMVTRAKQTWTGAVVGLAIALASPTFLKQIKQILNSNSTTGGTADNWVNKALTIKEIAVNVLNFLLSVFGILAIIALVIGGGMYLTAYGEEKKIDSAKRIITYAIIGIVVALSALVIVRQVASLIGAQ